MPPQAGRLVLASEWWPVLSSLALFHRFSNSPALLLPIYALHPYLQIDFHSSKPGPGLTVHCAFGQQLARLALLHRDHLTSGADTRTLKLAAFVPQANVRFPFLFHLMVQLCHSASPDPLQPAHSGRPSPSVHHLCLSLFYCSSLRQLAPLPLDLFDLHLTKLETDTL